jgi:hypothetical protein
MTGHRQPWYLDRLRAELERVAAIEDRRERSPALGRLRPALDRLRPSPQTLAALAAVVALVAVVLTVARESDVERQAAPQPAPGKKVVATDVERGVRFSLDGRVLTVQLLPNRPNPIETVSGAQMSATCGTNVAAPPDDPRSEITLTRLWPAGQTSLSYPFPSDVSSWCRLDHQSGSIVAFVRFPGASPGAKGPIAETAFKWAGLIAASPQTCNDYTGPTACEQITCQRADGTPIPNCRRITLEWAVTFISATVEDTAISGDRAAATLSNHVTLQMRRTATGEWLIDKLGPLGLPAELRRKLPGA